MNKAYPSRLSCACLLLAAAVLLAACASAGVSAAANAPDSIAGAWFAVDVRGNRLYILFLDDGEFRAGYDMDVMFDGPVALGRYTYESGRLTLDDSVIGSTACGDAGTYFLTSYEAGTQGIMTLRASEDNCPARTQFFGGVQWTQAAVEG